MQDTLKHEIIHGLGFGHKKQLVDTSMPYDRGELNKDDIHGINTIYGNVVDRKLISYIFNDMSEYDDRQVFLVRNKKLLYQSPIDINGYYEFNLSNEKKDFTELFLFRKGANYFYSKDKTQSLDIKPTDSIYSIRGIDWES